MMKSNIILNENELKEILFSYYNSFRDGYIFERFLKKYLEEIGLEEVIVTQKSRDGGIDLKAIRSGIGGFGGADFVSYSIQAKRYKPDVTVSPESVRALRGVLESQSVGIFITTGKFTQRTVEEFKNTKDRPVILIDGNSLINSCIDYGLGFYYKPVFSKDSLSKIMGEDLDTGVSYNMKNDSALIVEKAITANDIRARILSCPRVIMKEIPIDKNSIDVFFNENICKSLSINKSRSYFAGITDLYRKFGLLSKDGIITPSRAKWILSKDKLTVLIETIINT